MPRLSVIMPYYNREKQLINTLRTMNVSSVANDTEVIIIDDGSSPRLDADRIGSIIGGLNFSLKITYIDPVNKWWKNQSAIPYNMGIDQSSGEIILLNHAECLHRGDILSYASKKTARGNYLTYSTYNLPDALTNNLLTSTTTSELLKQIENLKFEKRRWWNHPKYRPTYRPFSASLHIDDLQKIGWFDEDLSNGPCFEDTEFRMRCCYYLNAIVVPAKNMVVIHQSHERAPISSELKNNNRQMYLKKRKRMIAGGRTNIIKTKWTCSHRINKNG